jgi:hypothetical protein
LVQACPSHGNIDAEKIPVFLQYGNITKEPNDQGDPQSEKDKYHHNEGP